MKMESVAQRASDRFLEVFARAPVCAGVSPGRVNLIGEHTDYNGGLVLPAAVPYFTGLVLAPRDDLKVQVASTFFDAVYSSTLESPPSHGFGDFVLGMARELGMTTGFDAAIHSNLPMSAGMSSSAALLLAALRALAPLLGQDLYCLDAARLGRKVENDYIGVPCGLMDQFIVACGQDGAAMLLDCHDDTWHPVRSGLRGASWFAIYTGIKRNLASGNYKVMVVDSREALELLLASSGLSRTQVRTLEPSALAEVAAKAGLSEYQTRLLRHFVSENRRVLAFEQALVSGDLDLVGSLLTQGHWSLSRDFGVSLPAIDGFIEGCSGLPGCRGVRITGAGFGGTLLGLVEDRSEEETLAAMEELAGRYFPSGWKMLKITNFCEGAKGWKL